MRSSRQAGRDPRRLMVCLRLPRACRRCWRRAVVRPRSRVCFAGVTELLLKGGANANAVDKEDELAALHIACALGYEARAAGHRP